LRQFPHPPRAVGPHAAYPHPPKLASRGARRHRNAVRATTFAAVLAVAVAAGCGQPNTITGTGDATGLHLFVYASDRNQAAGQYDLYLWDQDVAGFHLMRGINSLSAERHPALSSNGRFVAFQSDRGGGTLDDIYIYDRANANFVEVPGMNSADPEIEPRFSGDALKLAYVQGGAVKRIRLYNGQTKTLIPLPGLDTTGVSFSDTWPSPNYDASRIAFVSDRSGNPNVYVYDRVQQRLLDIPELASGSDEVEPNLSSDGRYLCFSSNRPGDKGGYDLYLYDFSDSTLRPLSAANTTSDERAPVISDRADVVVFQSNRSDGKGRWDLWIFDAVRSTVFQPNELSSVADDIEPSLRWPY
jgi:Tol biopolymer transport system component